MLGDLSEKLRHADRGEIRELAGLLGPRGIIKSIYYSIRHTGKPGTLLVDKRASVDIDPDATVDVEDVFSLGVYHTRIIHPVLGGTRLDVNEGATFRTGPGRPQVGPGTVLNVRGNFEMGYSYVNGLCRIHCFDSITIGKRCAIAWNVDILDTHSHELAVDGEWRQNEAPVVIGDDVWIGHGVSVLPGVEIGDGAVIAANSLVNSDVPSNTLAAGTPAEVVESNVEWR